MPSPFPGILSLSLRQERKKCQEIPGLRQRWGGAGLKMCWSWKVFQAMECYENNKKRGLPNEKKKPQSSQRWIAYGWTSGHCGEHRSNVCLA